MVINSTDWVVDSTRGMDVWQTTHLNTSLTFDQIDLTRDDRGRARGCMHESTGGVWLAKLEFGGSTSLSQVQSGASQLGEHCSIAIDEREKMHLAYTNESGFLTVAYQRVTGEWNIRTVENVTTVVKIKLLLNSKGEENVFWLDSNNGLHLSTYTTWWTHSDVLLGTQIGSDFDAYLDTDDSLNIFYRNVDTTQMIHGVLGADGNWTLTVLAAGQDLGPAMAFAKDPSTGNVQYAYASSSSSVVTVLRDLTGQENGRLSPTIETIATGPVGDKYATQAINDLDLDCDGVDDLLVSSPAANSDIGAIDIFWGSTAGLNAVADANLSGISGGDNFGSSMANVGDVNGDGCDDLLIGAVGAVDGAGGATGVAYLYYGGSRNFTSSDWFMDGPTGIGAKFGGTVSAAGDVNNDGFDDILVASIGYSQPGGKGKVFLYLGSANGPSMSSDWNNRGTWEDVIQGWSMAAVGDTNDDGFDDIAIGAAGSFSDITGNGRVGVYTGSATGIMTLDNRWTTTTTNTLLGYAVAGIGDINQDGFDDVAFTEPLYDNSALGRVSIVLGSSAGLPSNPDMQIVGTESSQILGSAVSLIGDINDDGVEEIAISSIGLGTSNGKVEYYFADSNQLLRAGVNPLLIEGVSGQHLGRTITGGGDVDGDGQFEILVTSLDKDMAGNPAGAVVQIEKRNREATDIPIQVDKLDLDLDDSGRFHLFVTSGSESRHLERPNAVTNAAEDWKVELFDTSVSSMVVTRSGKTIVLDGSNAFTEQSASTILTTNHPLATHERIDLDLVINDEQSLLFTTSYRDATVMDVEVRAETDSGFQTSRLIENSSLGAGISSSRVLAYNETGTPNGWTITGTNLTGGDEFGPSSGCQLADGTGVLVISDVGGNQTVLRYIDDVGNSTSFAIWTHQSENDVVCLADGTLLVALAAASGAAEVMSINGSNMTSMMSTTLVSTNSSKAHILAGGDDNAVLFTENGSANDAKICDLSTSTCSPIMIGYSSSETLSAGATREGNNWVAYDGGVTQRMTLAIIGDASVDSVYTATALGDICGVDMETDGAGNIRIVACHEDLNSNNRLTSYRIYNDWDRDFVPIPWDDVPFVGGQWNDGDSDGYGDNIDGPVHDQCPSSGTGFLDRGSRWGTFGCSDQDLDGWADSVDDCLNDQGNSWIDTQGCDDPDGDGWSSAGLHTTTPDQDPINWYQQRDTDEDGHLDNHGPDCCGDGSSDIYPLNGNQWEDLDNDGWGDNHDYEYANSTLRTQYGVDVDNDGSPDWYRIDWSGDQCPGLTGFSAFDRGGCLDTDGDGWSDPHIAQSPQESTWVYNRSECHAPLSDGHQGCADNWPGGSGNAGEPCDDLTNCSQQWHDKDSDGYGDNTTIGAWMQDAFDEDLSQWNDTDLDGYGDNPSGTTPDDCPVTWGNSTVDRLGCLDSDGDSWSDPDSTELAHPNGNADSNSSNPDQWRDSDGDGFGDFTSQTNGDFCPQQFGYSSGDGGRGCPLPAEDSDGDGIINDEDVCANTTIGETIDIIGPWKGCSDNQKDDDGDGVSNTLDRCDNTTAGATVDENGCSDDQLTIDSDNDGVPDIDDECSNTDPLQIDEHFDNVTGCATYQLDEDNDSVSNALDECPGTPDGAEVDEVGCPRNDIDTDGDGFFDDVDAFPSEITQWADLDMDGFGNEIAGFQGDSCTNVAGNSSGTPIGDRWGCPDSDGDGRSDPAAGWGVEEGADAFINDPTQWQDSDGDGFGNNLSGNNGDACPLVAGVADGIDGMGCPAVTDGEGNEVNDCSKYRDVYDPSDHPGMTVPNDLHSCDWYDEWYGATESTSIPWGMIGMGGGGLLLLLILTLVMVRVLRGGDDWDDDDEDDFYDDDEDDDDIFAAGAPATRGGSWKAPSARQDFSGLGGNSNQPPARGGSGPPSRGGGPSRRSAGPPSRGGGPSTPSRAGPPGRSAPSPKTTRRKVAVDDIPDGETRKVRKVSGGAPPSNAKTRSTKKTKSTGGGRATRKPKAPVTWEGLFTPRDSANYEKSLGDTREALHAGETERNILRKLQTDGWNAKQSRFILEEATS